MPGEFNWSDHTKSRINSRGEKRPLGLAEPGEAPAWLEKHFGDDRNARFFDPCPQAALPELELAAERKCESASAVITTLAATGTSG
jgi:hypothetical protein